MSRTDATPGQVAATMPREHLMLTIAEMEVGEVRRAPRWALKLDDAGRCYLLADRHTRAPSVGEDFPVQIWRFAEGYAVTLPADDAWHTGSLAEVMDGDEPTRDVVPVVNIEFAPPRPSAEPASLEATFGAKTLIRIGFDTTIDASQVIGIRRFVEEADRGDVYFANVVDDRAVVLTLIQMQGGAHYASSLSVRELDNRLRKAGHRII